MTEKPLAIRADSQGLTFRVYVQPRSSKNMIVGLHGDALKIRIKAPPVDGAANKMCVKYLSGCLKLPKTFVEILSGQSSRTKRVRVSFKSGKDIKAERKRLEKAIRALAVT